MNRVFAFFMLILLMPLMIFMTLLIFLITFEHPVFSQQRFAGHDTFFTIYKFKTITKNKKQNVLLEVIRRTHLDELPNYLILSKGK